MINLRNCSIHELYEMAKARTIYGFGVSKQLDSYCYIRCPDYAVSDILTNLVDNDKDKVGLKYRDEIEIISVTELRQRIRKEDIILIISVHAKEIIEQLDSIAELDDIETYILNFIDDYPDGKIDMEEWEKGKQEEMIIPPVIHYCWFGKNPIPLQYEKYIESWKRYCPGYQIIRWDESNYDVRKHPYMEKAYQMGKYAFVSDYARLDIVYQQGGIYLDTDVELIQSPDRLRRFNGFMGYESTQIVNSGLGFGAVKGNAVIKKLRDGYDSAAAKQKGEPQFEPCTVAATRILREYGLRCDNSFQMLGNQELAVLPTEFLCGIRLMTRVRQITENTCSLHHWEGIWGGKEKVKEIERLIDSYAGLLGRIKNNEVSV